jgi:hypothetical protein
MRPTKAIESASRCQSMSGQRFGASGCHASATIGVEKGTLSDRRKFHPTAIDFA